MATADPSIEQTPGSSSSDRTSVKEYIREDDLTPTVSEFFYPIYKHLFGGSDYVKNLQDTLHKADISYPAEIYISAVIGYSLFAGLLGGFLVGGAIALVFFILGTGIPDIAPEAIPYGTHEYVKPVVEVLNLINSPSAVLISSIVVFAILAAGVFSLSMFYPGYKAKRRERRINLMLGDAVGFMYSLSVGGSNQIDIIHTLANADDAYGEVSVEFKRISNDMQYFNTDYQSAVREMADITPSDELQAFLTDMLSVIDSGGDMTSFLDTQQDIMRERARKKQEELLDTLEFFGEMYLSLNVLPMGLLVVFVVISLMGTPQLGGMFATVYGVLPAINIIFILLIGSVKRDELGNGTLHTEGDIAALGEDETSLVDLGVIDRYLDSEHSAVFQKIRRQEFRYRIVQIFRSPWEFFRRRPPYILAFTLPITIFMFAIFLLSGVGRPTIDGFIEEYYLQSMLWIYIPVFLNIGPLAFFTEWNTRSRGKITDGLTDTLRKLANANQTGQPLMEAIQTTSRKKDDLISQEFRQMYKKAQFGTEMSSALVEFNNRYRIPRLARAMKLIQKAQEASSNITPVLETAAISSQYEDELEEERVSRTKVQVGVAAMTFLVFLGVLLMMDVFFIDKMVSSISQENMPLGSFQDVNPNVISMAFFHGVTVQALSSGAVSGYVQTGDLKSSYKYMIAYMLLTAVVWGVVS